MKKLLALLLLAALMLSLAACAGEETATKNSETTTAANTTAEPSDDTVLNDEDYQMDLSLYVTVPELSSLNLSQEELTENMNQTRNDILQYNATYEAADADYAAVLGDAVNIHYKGYAADESDSISADTLANMTNISYDEDGNLGAGYDLVLGSGAMIGAYESEENPEKNNAGFEDQLVGMKAGETRTITVTFSDSYSNSVELQGKVIKFDVTANSIQKSTVPEALTDEMISDYTGGEYTTVAAFEEYALEYYKGQMAYSKLWESATVLSYPTELLDSEISAYIADYITSVYAGEELSDEETKTIFDEQYDDATEYAQSLISTNLILEVLFDRYNISLTYGKYKEMLQDLYELEAYTAMMYGITSAEQFEEYFGRDMLIRQCKFDLLRDELAKQAKFE